MRPPSEGKDERRSRINANQRTRYNQEKKQVLLQQMRQGYAQNKKAKQTGSEAQSPDINRVNVRSCEVLIVDEINNFSPKIDTCAGKTNKGESLHSTEKERTRSGIKSQSCLSNTSHSYSYRNKGIISYSKGKYSYPEFPYNHLTIANILFHSKGSNFLCDCALL